MATKKMDVPDIDNLLGKIAEKRDSGEIPKTEIQHVQPVVTAKSKAVQTVKQQSVKTDADRRSGETRGIGGRPSQKRDDVEYVKVSPRIPKKLKKQVEIALIEERFLDTDKRPITTLDEIVAFALERLFK